MDKPRLVYVPREDATPEGELSALAAIYNFALTCHERKKTAETVSGEEIEPGGPEGAHDE